MFRCICPDMPVGKWFTAVIGILGSYFAPVQTLILIVIEFIAIDFVIGVIASRVRAKRAGKLSEWGFESDKAWHTVLKAVFVVLGIVMAHHVDAYVVNFVDLHLTNIFCGFVCGVEFWSFLENAACISDHPVFRWLKKYMGRKVKETCDLDLDNLEDDVKRHKDDNSSVEIK